MIDYADKDRDGRISFEEFVEIITKEYPQVWEIKMSTIFQKRKSRKVEKLMKTKVIWILSILSI